MSDLADLSAVELVALFRAGQASPVEATEAAFERIRSLQPVLNAWRVTDPEGALASARASERRWRAGAPLGALDGVPTAIKDVFATRGWSTRWGSTLTDDAPGTDDAPAVARLREAGAVFLGKTNTSEFHWKTVTDSPLTGITRNPWNPALTPGGSCGGNAAAVAAGMATLAVGTDGGGSIRVPCAFSGLVGLKPSFGRVPLAPPGAFGTMAHVGPMTRTVADAALMLNAIAKPDARDWQALPPEDVDYLVEIDVGVAGLRVAFSPDLGFVRVEPQIAACVAAAAQTFAGLGARVEIVDPGIGDTRAVFETLAFAAIAHELRRFGAAERAHLDPGLLAVAEIGERIALADYLEATHARDRIGIRMSRFHERFDLLLTPTVPIAPFAVGRDVPDPARQRRWTEWAPFSHPFNLTKQPAATVPCGLTAEGLPVGLQIVGGPYRDRTVLRAAHAFERASPFAKPALDSLSGGPASA